MEFNWIPDDDGITANETYLQDIVIFLYLYVGTIPDIIYAFSCLSKYVDTPTEVHWNVVKCFIRYPISTQKIVL